MLEYKIDHKPNSAATSHIKDMDAVLREITNTYEVMLEVINQHESALSSPSINTFRKELQKMLGQAISLSDTIVDNSRKLVIISEQASKQLLAFEESFSSTLEKHATKVEQPYSF